MTEQLPTPTAEQQAFSHRQGRCMASLVNGGMDLRDAEREAARLIADELRTEGIRDELVDALLSWALKLADIGTQATPGDFAISDLLHDQLVETFVQEGGALPSGPNLLLEKRVKTRTGFPMFVFSNESKHPGCPHVTVIVGEEKVNISISNKPEVLAGDPNLPGIGAALKAVKKHCKALRKEWDAFRPDDQKLENSKRRRVAKGKARR